MFQITFDVLWCVGCTFVDHYPSSAVITTASVFVDLHNVMSLSANLGWCISQQGPPRYRMHHIWKMTYWGSRFWNIPFIEGKKTILKYMF